jgi:DNA processing protein
MSVSAELPVTSASACEACLRRGYLVGRLAPRIAGMLDLPQRSVPGLMTLGDEELIAAVAGRSPEGPLRFIDSFDSRAARARLESDGVEAVCRHSDAYPRALANLSDPPRLLFALGDLSLLSRLRSEPAVAVVGARRASPYGLEAAYEVGRGLGAAGVVVVSGLALGIDAAAHRGCLDAGGPGIAVLACGPDVAYPRTNVRLHDRMRRDALIVSELPPGQRPFRWSFPARNRIMAGLSATTVVVEARAASGSMITASIAAQLGRTVAAVPGAVTSSLAAGTNALLKDGALVVTSAQDLLDDLFGVGERSVVQSATVPVDDPVDRAILDAVESQLGIEGICRAAGLPIREVRAALSRLEASGHIRLDALGHHHRTLRAR